MYFRLYDHCKLVESADSAAIHNLQSGDILPVNAEELQLLKKCQTSALEDIMEISESANRNSEFIAGLIIKKLGSIIIKQAEQQYL